MKIPLKFEQIELNANRFLLITPPFICFFLDSTNKFLIKHEVFRKYFIVILDNFFHGFISSYCWLIISKNSRIELSIIELVLAGFFSCYIDLDHFISARSLSLHSALNLKHPAIIFHSVFFQIFINILIFLLDRKGHYTLIYRIRNVKK